MTKPNEPFEADFSPDDTPQESALEPVNEPVPESEPAVNPKVKSSLAAGTWAALIAGLLLLVLLLVFIVQNQQSVEVNLFVWTWHFPAGVAYLLSAIIGAFIMALVGGWRMFELRRQIRHPRTD